jgi:hypothetical protein
MYFMLIQTSIFNTNKWRHERKKLFFDNAENSKPNTRRHRHDDDDDHHHHLYSLLQGIGNSVFSDSMINLLFKIFFRHCMLSLSVGFVVIQLRRKSAWVRISDRLISAESINQTHMKGAPKVMPPIYFHGNYKRHWVHSNADGKSKLSATEHYRCT